jgi:AraC-like DNA-binding protein
MRDRGLSWQARLRDAGLPASLLFEPERPIALLAGTRFIATASTTEGPDIGCRVVHDTSIVQLASFGRVALGARTPREALANLMRAYPHHSSHEQFAVVARSGTVAVRHRFLVDVEDTELHLCHQYVAALIRSLTAGTGLAGPRLAGVKITPHPVSGLDHLRPYLDNLVDAATDRTATITISDAVLDRPYLRQTRERTPVRLSSIRGDGTLAYSLRTILPGVLELGPAQIAQIAALAGTSPRTLQRRLAAEGTSLSDEIDRLRREQALGRVVGSRDPVGDIAADLGYSDQSSLTRAMRRWANMPPSQMRRG